MRVYIATRTDNLRAAQLVRDVFEEAGHQITFDWTPVVEQLGASSGVDGTLSEERRRECAMSDLKGVRDADALVMIAHPGLCGTLIEVGMAIAWDIPVFVLGEPERNSVFFALPHVLQVPEGVLYVNHIEHKVREFKEAHGS